MKAWIKLLLGLSAIIIALQPSCTCSNTRENIRLDGSSTVYVLSEAVAEDFQKEHQAKISIGVSGTGGGFKKLCSGRVDFIGASRQIKDSEKQLCQEHKIEPTEFKVAMDGIVVAVNHENKWLHTITVSMLKKLFEPQAEGKINKWSDLDPSFPNRNLEIFAPGISSGTYDYFTSVIVGTEHASRGDMTTSEDDNVLVHGIYSNVDSIGFFSFAYFLENQEKLKALAIIDDRKPNRDPVMPAKQTIHDGSYSPLSRPVFIYVNQSMLNNAGKKFLSFYLQHCSKIADDVGFIPLPKEETLHNLEKLMGK